MSKLAIRLLALELIVVLAGAGISWLSHQTPEARRQETLRQLSEFNRALHAYMRDNNGNPPTTPQGLDALYSCPKTPPLPKRWFGPYLAGPMPQDPWGDQYVYESPGPNGDAYRITSFGDESNRNPTTADITSDDAANL